MAKQIIRIRRFLFNFSGIVLNRVVPGRGGDDDGKCQHQKKKGTSKLERAKEREEGKHMPKKVSNLLA